MTSWKTINVLWISRHEMTTEQIKALKKRCHCSEIKIHQVDKTIKDVTGLKCDIISCDILAVVAPIELQKDFLDFMKIGGFERPMIVAKTERVFDESGNHIFKFQKWEQIRKIEIEKEDFSF